MLFNNSEELINICNEYNKKIYEVMLEREIEEKGCSKEDVYKKMKDTYGIMEEAVEKSLNEDIRSIAGLIGGEGKKIVKNRPFKNKTICGDIMKRAVGYSMGVLEVNASMGRVIAAPTAGSCGIIPGTFKAIKEEFNLSENDIIEGLLTASAIGLIVTKNATVAGAEGGCQAETGTAAAMSAGAIVHMLGGDHNMVFTAAAITFKNILGLVCDPIAGLVEAPCQKRNGIGASNALISAEMVFCGVDSIIPFDEVVEAMYKVGRSLSFDLRESGLGGLAGTKTGIKLSKKILEN